ncbi:SMP-30/gluconolactonase/LRE family protein [bacterium]|nr:SMP-30/gluconolactonase/LRE family protein [bacterium]
MKPELIADYSCVIGEGPIWHPMEQRLYWIDIQNGRIFRYHPASGHHEQCFEGDIVGGFTIQENGALLLFMARGSVKLWHENELTTIIDEIPDERDSRFNDVIADPAGRVFCGTMSTDAHPGGLYRLDVDGTCEKLLADIACSNGLGFSPDLKRLYYTDSTSRTIFLFDYDKGTGSISNKRTFLDTSREIGVPDGLTIDAEGYIWSARWDGGCLIRYTADGIEDLRIPFPARKVSSLTFGGRDYTDIYVTTAGGDNKLSEGKVAGGLFHLNLGIQGRPEFLSRVGLSPAH